MIFCSMTCDPHHSKFLSSNETRPYEHPDLGNITLITILNYYILDSFTEAMYESCSEVTNPSSNSLALTNFCGPYGEDCNAH